MSRRFLDVISVIFMVVCTPHEGERFGRGEFCKLHRAQLSVE
jgi:hypothetical protein